ncbi:hypothetical protein HETIRDRAFT_317857 [Heterobasidion irregulare TC 32-1]|uniref:Uncharacterized protein n=1 Tax=Heterobasidion irregulare (strain TC 32-1) TaxID=747525 RepID=W4K964_HETIT|nr:uncharacterized protein HETIRDRAFT_317857 [Heterobasidion irregulare TC 32-1]ETW82318.1 hypothetical protein HETIRDRAFT_317857 [Heterobasidion irregulare TC 32-1]
MYCGIDTSCGLIQNSSTHYIAMARPPPPVRTWVEINIDHSPGFLLYIYLFAVSLANLVIVLVAPAAYTNLLASVQRVLYAILPSRILLNLRQASRVNEEPTSHWSQVLGLGLSFVRNDPDDDRVDQEVEQ